MTMLSWCSRFLSESNYPLMMTSKRLRKMFVFILLLVLAGFWLFYIQGSGHIACYRTYKNISIKRDSGRFLHLPHIDCSRNTPFLIILVTSSPDSKPNMRMAIRVTWGKEKLIANKRIVTFFLLGFTLEHDKQIAIAAESKKYRDIIQKDFIDTYYNLTLKTMMGLEWVHKFCSQSSFVMKTDSDVFVNPYYLTELLLKKNRITRFFTGFLKLNDQPIRHVFSKWYVNKYEYPGNNYPPFCSGTGYIFSTDVGNLVYNVSEIIPFIKLEDVFIGLCLAELNIIPEELHSEQTFFPEGIRFSVCQFRKIVTSHPIQPHDLLVYWNALEKSTDKECSG